MNARPDESRTELSSLTNLVVGILVTVVALVATIYAARAIWP